MSLPELQRAQALWLDFIADNRKREFVCFGRNLFVAVLVTIYGWICMYLIFGGTR